MRELIVDVEANALVDPDTIWCICTKIVGKDEARTFDIRNPNYLKDFRDYASSEDTTFIGHNFIGYDRAVISSLGLYDIRLNRIIDTLVLSRLFSAVRDDHRGHGLEGWGQRLKFKKLHTDITDWSRFTPEMVERCERDVLLNERVYRVLQTEGRAFGEGAVRLEHSVAWILEETRRAGFAFARQRAEELFQIINAEAADVESKIRKEFPRVPVFDREFTVRYKKDGTRATGNLKWLPEELRKTAGDCSRIEWQDFNPASSKQIIARLAGYWSPTEFTPNERVRTPKVNETNLDTLHEDAPETAKLIRHYKLLASRSSTLESWLKCVGPDDRIHGKIIHIGANTHRCAHHNPNTANIPAIQDKRGRPNLYGKEFRSLWGVADPDRRLVGVDAKGIQLRILAHLRNNPEFTTHVVSGDPHQYHADLTGYSRQTMKTFIYAFLLGCGAVKAGLIVNGGQAQGRKLIDQFLKMNPDLVSLRHEMEEWADKGHYKLPDGRFIQVKSAHYALAVALQGLEQMVMKTAIVLVHRWVKESLIDAQLVGFVHDELLYDCHHSVAELVKEKVEDSIRVAGEIFKLRCPMEGDGKIGMSWADVH